MSASAARWNTRSIPRTASSMAAASATSVSMTSSAALPACCARLRRWPQAKLSTARTLRPRAMSASTKWEPMNPAPPVTRSMLTLSRRFRPHRQPAQEPAAAARQHSPPAGAQQRDPERIGTDVCARARLAEKAEQDRQAEVGEGRAAAQPRQHIRSLCGNRPDRRRGEFDARLSLARARGIGAGVNAAVSHHAGDIDRTVAERRHHAGKPVAVKFQFRAASAGRPDGAGTKHNGVAGNVKRPAAQPGGKIVGREPHLAGGEMEREGFSFVSRIHDDAGVIMDPGNEREPFPLHLPSREMWFAPDDFAARLRRRPFHISSNAVVFRTSAIRATGGCRPELELYGDWFACVVTALRDGAVYIPRVMAYRDRKSTR